MSLATIVNKLRPLGDRVLVRKIEPTTHQIGKIVLPETATDKLPQGEVIAVGPGHLSSYTGVRTPLQIKVGDKVILGEYGGQNFKVNNSQQYAIFREDDILCVLHDD